MSGKDIKKYRVSLRNMTTKVAWNFIYSCCQFFSRRTSKGLKLREPGQKLRDSGSKQKGRNEKSMEDWAVPNTKCCFNCIAGNVTYGRQNSKNIVIVRIWIFHQDPFFF